MAASKSLSFMKVQGIHARLQLLGDPKRAEVLRRYFKTGPGEYGREMYLSVSVLR
jgi:hypothetical protein